LQFTSPPPKKRDSIEQLVSTREFDTPYKQTIEELQKLAWESSPLAKVDIVYNALKFKLAEEVDLFWEGCDKFMSANQRNIDIDNLQGITIYIVWAM